MAPVTELVVCFDGPAFVIHDEATPSIFNGETGRCFHVERRHLVVGVMSELACKVQSRSSATVLTEPHIVQAMQFHHHVAQHLGNVHCTGRERMVTAPDSVEERGFCYVARAHFGTNDVA